MCADLHEPLNACADATPEPPQIWLFVQFLCFLFLFFLGLHELLVFALLLLEPPPAPTPLDPPDEPPEDPPPLLADC